MEDPWGQALEDELRGQLIELLRSRYPEELVPRGARELLELAYAAMSREAGDSQAEKLYAAEVADVLRRYAAEHP